MQSKELQNSLRIRSKAFQFRHAIVRKTDLHEFDLIELMHPD